MKRILFFIFFFQTSLFAQDLEKAYFAGGCFWCTESIFQRIRGVIEVVPGYMGGHIKNPAYREVCNGDTGHTETIKVLYEQDIISYGELLEIFFLTHDPTTLNRQGNDVGSQYRSAIFYNNLDDLVDKINFYSRNNKSRIQISKKGQKKYFKLFNEKKTTQFI